MRRHRSQQHPQKWCLDAHRVTLVHCSSRQSASQCSSLHTAASSPLPQPRRRLASVAKSAAAESASPSATTSFDWLDPPQPSELQRLINSIPYRKLFLWGCVGVLLWPLHDFFGVRTALARRHACAPLRAARPRTLRPAAAPTIGPLARSHQPLISGLLATGEWVVSGLLPTAAATAPPPPQIAMGTFIVSFIGHSFVASALDTQPLRWLAPDLIKQRRILVALFFTIIIAFIS